MLTRPIVKSDRCKLIAKAHHEKLKFFCLLEKARKAEKTKAWDRKTGSIFESALSEILCGMLFLLGQAAESMGKVDSVKTSRQRETIKCTQRRSTLIVFLVFCS